MPTQPPSRPAARESGDDAGIEPASASGQPAVSLAGLGIAGLSRRRVGIAVTALVALWIVVGFAGQASAAARAADRAVQEQATNETLAANVASLRDELDLVQTQRWTTPDPSRRAGEPGASGVSDGASAAISNGRSGVEPSP